MLRSDAPCAMARTLTPELPSAPNSLAAMPGVPAMPSPTTARMLQSRVTSTRWICPCRISLSKASRTTAAARSASAWASAKQIECSELPCEISATEMPCSRSAPNSRWAVPGTPIMPVPSTLISAIRSMLVIPLTGCADAGSAQMSVPGFSGANVLRIQIGMPWLTAGAMVCGWITFAPKYASSIASLYESESMIVASGTRRGSALSTPSTSVQITISAASSKAPKIEAEKSLPSRPSVVCSPSRVRAMKPVMMSVTSGSPGMIRAAFARDSGQRTLGPSGAGSTSTMSRASIQSNAARPPAARLQVAGEETGRPDLAESGDEIADDR